MNARRKYTHLFFDLDNTLWDFNENSFHAMQQSYSFYKLGERQHNFNSFFKVFSENNTRLWDEYRNGAVQKKELIRLRFQLTFDKLSITDIDAMEMNNHYLNEMPKQKRLMPGAHKVLEYLRIKGYKLFIITNGFSEVQQRKMEAAGILRYFKKVFVSETVKAPKPARQIFEHALKSSNAPKHSSLMIGDDYHADITGAMNFGIDAVYLNADDDSELLNLIENGNKPSTLYRIKSLDELTLLL